MEVLVTGGNGFIGSHLVEKLLQKKYQVRCLIRKTSDLRWIKNLHVKFFYGDIRSSETLIPAVKNVERIYHLSGQLRARTEKEFYEVNFGGTKNLLEAARQNAPELKRFVYVSSQAAVGPSKNGKFLSEEETPCPISLYGKSKLQGEKIVAEYKDYFPYTIIRPPSVYGERDDDIMEIFKYIKFGVKPLIGKQEKRISIIHVSDLVDGIILAAEHKRGKNESFFITNDEASSIRELENKIAAAMDKKAVFIYIPEFLLDVAARSSEFWAKLFNKPALLNKDKALEMKQRYWLLSSEKASKLLDFKPMIDIESGLKKTYRWYVEHGWL